MNAILLPRQIFNSPDGGEFTPSIFCNVLNLKAFQLINIKPDGGELTPSIFYT